MKKPLLILLIILSACQDQKEQSIAESDSISNINNENRPIVERVWLKYEYEEEYVLDEVYIFSDSDSLVNQSKVFKNEKLDTLKSHFYDFSFVRENDSSVKVNLNYFSDLYVDHKDEIADRKITVYYTDRAADSITHNTKSFDNVPFSDLVVNFYLKSQEDPVLNGFILEEIFLKGEEDKIIRGYTYIDNHNVNSNPYDIRKYRTK